MNRTYTYHLGVYSKLIRGHDPNGAIKRGTEARVNGKTKDFPADLHSLCRPSLFFVGEPLITDVDPRLIWGGVFVYQPIQIGGVYYSAFGRIQARSESGLGLPGRKFTHCAVIFVKEKWEPGLIKWAAEMLFTKIHGGRCWGDPINEMDKNHQALLVPALTRTMIDSENTGNSDASIEMKVRGRIPSLDSPDYDVNDADKSPYPILAARVANEFFNHNLRLEGRWLNLAFGVGVGVEGQGARGFYVRFDARQNDQISPVPQLPFDDNNRARRLTPIKSSELEIGIGWSELKGPNQKGRYERLTNDVILWPDQISYLEGRGVNAPDTPPLAPQKPAGRPLKNVLDIRDDDAPYVLTNSLPVAPKGQDQSPEFNLPHPPYLNSASDTYSEGNYLSYDSIFDDVSIRKFRSALRQIVGRCQLLDPENGYNSFGISTDFEKFSDAIQHLVEYVCIYATLADVDDLRPFLDDLFTHEPIPVLGLPSASRGGLSQLILSTTLDIISHGTIHEWITKQHRIEGNLRIHKRNNREIDPNYQTYNPQRQRLDAFFSWLNEVDFLSDKHAVDYSDQAFTVIMREINDLTREVAKNIREKWNI